MMWTNSTRHRAAMGLCTLVHSILMLLGLHGPVPAQQLPGDRIEAWQGYRQLRFQLAGRDAWLVEPREAAEGKPWIWRMEFFGHEPQADLALLARGFHVAYLDLQNLYGGPPAMEAMDQFHDAMVRERGLAPRVVLEGFSRGGLFSLNWGTRHPERVACIYNDAPVCDMRSWPGGLGNGPGSKDDWQRCLTVYGLSEAAAKEYPGHPVDHTGPLARGRVPLLHVCGDADEVVPFAENTRLFAERLRAQGGSIFVIAKPGVKHHPHSLVNPAAIVNFVLAHTVRNASTEILPESPAEHQVVQRAGTQPVPVRVSGWIQQPSDRLEACVVLKSREAGKPESSGAPGASAEVVLPWQLIEADGVHGRYDTNLSLPPGGWYELQLRTTRSDGTHAHVQVGPIGVGEVFVIAGQSNATNSGSERQTPQTGMVSTFDGQQWRPAADPQPGTADGSQGGSFAPSLGDALFEHYRVPIAVASTGAGATSVRQWLPKGGRMQQLPTIDAYVTPVAPGEWASDGLLFDGLARRLEALGPRGCRAVLWHQGESDAGQARAGYPADRQISGRQYAEFLRQVIEASRARAGWELPWLVAQTTYHSEQDPADEEFRAAQRSVVEAGIAVAGPDTDQLRAEFRDGVHFNARGLREHGQAWAKSIVTWLDQEVRGGNVPGPSRDRDPGR